MAVEREPEDTIVYVAEITWVVRGDALEAEMTVGHAETRETPPTEWLVAELRRIADEMEDSEKYGFDGTAVRPSA